ncbi:LCP family protein [Streptomyces sp. NBC_01283]|uniref:LCP family protein n=1 Tax=Streptomyces sp. NBC_01283 TaxID=2903812 RepID=UPI00352E9DF5|nr:LCP family protein [Streptomyces sp. NBC_01283]
MNDRQYDPYAGGDPYAGEYAADQYQVVGYDEYGQPVYQQVQPSASYDQYGAQAQQQQSQQQSQQQPPQQQQQQPQGYGYDPYATGQQAPVPPYDSSYGTGAYGSDSYDSASYGTYDQQQAHQQPQQAHQQQAAQAQQTQTGWIPQQSRQPEPEPEAEPEPRRPQERERDPAYETQQFSFIEEPDEESEDVIDWLKFTESRTERREEAKRRGRSRVVALVVVLALVIAGGVGYLWYAGKLPGLSDDAAGGGDVAAGPQNRDVIVVHLHNTKGGGTSTALLVNNTTTKRGATVLLPNSLSVTDDEGAGTTLGKSVDDDGSTGTRESIDSLLGTQVEGTWRLDTPYLNNLVELVGNIDIDTDANVPDPKAKKGEAPLVKKGEQQTLSGPMAVAYATYRATGESETAQLGRFGQVMQGVLRKLSSDPQAATTTVQSLAQILDPSLKEKDLGAFLAKLADRAKGGDYATQLLPVQQDGTLSEKAGASVVKNVLGGAVKNPDKDAAVRVGVKNASGSKGAGQEARISLVNGGYTFVDGGAGSGAQAASRVTYADADKKAQATEVAKTLGLPDSAVRKGKTAPNADVSVVLGQDYKAG